MGENANQIQSVNFTRMADGTAAEYAYLTPLYKNAAMVCRINCWNF